MSLKIFHICFIVLSILLAFGFGFWCIGHANESQQSGYTIAGIVSFLTTGLLVLYGINFIKKMKGIS